MILLVIPAGLEPATLCLEGVSGPFSSLMRIPIITHKSAQTLSNTKYLAPSQTITKHHKNPIEWHVFYPTAEDDNENHSHRFPSLTITSYHRQKSIENAPSTSL